MWNKSMWPGVVEVCLSCIVLSTADSLSILFSEASNSGRSIFF